MAKKIAETNKQKSHSVIELTILLLSIPKSFFVCLKLFGIREALKLPILVKYNTKVISLNGKVILTGNKRMSIGFGRISEIDESIERSIIKLDGDINIETPCIFGPGSKIISERNSKLVIGSNFFNTAKVTISNRGYTTIGKRCLISWNTWICDTDFHQVFDLNSDTKLQANGTTKIGDYVWICSNSSVINGAYVPNSCVVATGAIVNKAFKEENCLLGGIPAVIKKRNISWKEK